MQIIFSSQSLRCELSLFTGDFMPKKKNFLALCFIALTGISASSALAGFGAHVGINLGQPSFSFMSATVRTSKSPWVISIDNTFDDLHFAINADNWFINKFAVYPVSFFAFWGISGSLQLRNNFHIGTGARLGLGLNWFVLERKSLELYVQGAWNPCIGIEDDGGIGFMFRPLCFPVSTGARWYF